jgi:hypothetical protein
MGLLDTGERRSRGGRDRPAGDPHTAAYHFQHLTHMVYRPYGLLLSWTNAFLYGIDHSRLC